MEGKAFVISSLLFVLAGALLHWGLEDFYQGYQYNNIEAPCDRIKMEQIQTLKGQTIIQVPNLVKGNVTGTGSMKPIISKDSVIIYEKFEGQSLCVGDIITFENKECSNSSTIHRLLKKGKDSEGNFFMTKGDNNRFWDGCKLRAEDIKEIAVGVIY